MRTIALKCEHLFALPRIHSIYIGTTSAGDYRIKCPKAYKCRHGSDHDMLGDKCRAYQTELVSKCKYHK